MKHKQKCKKYIEFIKFNNRANKKIKITLIIRKRFLIDQLLLQCCLIFLQLKNNKKKYQKN